MFLPVQPPQTLRLGSSSSPFSHFRSSSDFPRTDGGYPGRLRAITDASLSSLRTLLGAGEQVLAAWDFTTNFDGGGDVLLSFDIGPGAEDLVIWHLQGNVWSAYTPAMLTYDANGLASITASSFSGYAVAGAIPEPCTRILLTATGAWFSLCRGRLPHEPMA